MYAKRDLLDSKAFDEQSFSDLLVVRKPERVVDFKYRLLAEKTYQHYFRDIYGAYGSLR
jgi:hypothetical protein